MENYKFDTNRKNAKYCPCGKSNRNGKFVPYKNFEKHGYCHSCDKTFLPDNGTIITPFISLPKPKLAFHDYSLISESGRNFKENNFITFLKTLFTTDEVKEVILKYLLGTSNHFQGGVVFWQIDNKEKVRAGKIFQFDKVTGKRQNTNWVHSVLRLNHFYNGGLQQCLFGLHLINYLIEAENKTIAIVEGEKTAIIMSVFKPEYVWLSTAGIGGFKADMLEPIKEFNIVAFPDKGEAYNKWLSVAIDLNKSGFNISVSDWLENQNDFESGSDIADVFIYEKNQTTNQIKTKEIDFSNFTTAEKIVFDWNQKDYKIKQLIEAFDLVDENGNIIQYY